RCLNGDGRTVLVCESLNFGSIGNWILGARSHGCVCTLSDVADGDCVAQVRGGLWCRANPTQPSVDHRLRKICSFSQETVSRVDGICSCLLRGIQHLVDG